MTMITISDENPRSIRAVELAAGAGQWLKCRTRDGLAVFGVPSQCLPGRYYLVTIDRCDCQDARRHACKHQLAVRLHVALAKGSGSVRVRSCAAQAEKRTSAFVASHTTDRGETVHLPRPDSESEARFWRRFED